MARRYSRREFLTDATFALGSSVLLKVFSPNVAETTPVQEQPQVSTDVNQNAMKG